MSKIIIALVLFAVLYSCSALDFKNIQGPASEFKNHQLPQPGDVLEQSNYARYRVQLTQQNGAEEMVWEKAFPVDAQTLDHGFFRLAFFTTMENFKVFLKAPGQEEFKELLNGKKSSMGLSTSASVPAVVFEKPCPVPQGMYQVKVVAKPEHVQFAKNNAKMNMMMVVENDSPYRVNSYLDTFKMVQGEEVGVYTKVYDEQAYRAKLMDHHGLSNTAELHELYDTTKGPLPHPDAIIMEEVNHIEWDIQFPDGHEEHINMAPSAANGAGNEGTFHGSFKATQAGDYVAEVIVSGKLPDGKPFERVVHQMFKVVSADEEMTLLPEAQGHYDDKDQMIEFDILSDVSNVKYVAGKKFKVFAQVWAQDDQFNSLKPVAFMTGLTIAQNVQQKHPETFSLLKAGLGKKLHAALAFPLKLHVNWMSMSNMHPSKHILLKNVRIQDVATSVPLTTAGQVKVHLAQEHKTLMSAQNGFDGTITEVMKSGPRPLKFHRQHRQRLMSAQNGNGYQGGHKVILSHGYCTDRPGFPADQFTNPSVFEDFNQNRNNDEFAQMLSEQCDKYDSCAIIGHSQGGLAALTALTYYWTSLDMNEKSQDTNRWIQSVGSPYQGTSASGWGDLGKTFGIACGSVQDMTPEGAKLWLSGIPQEARDHVYFYITDYGSWSSCSLASNLVLKWTNDGATESDRAKLPGGHYVLGKPKAKFCHTADMNYPSQTDKWLENNKFMNKKAATGFSA